MVTEKWRETITLQFLIHGPFQKWEKHYMPTFWLLYSKFLPFPLLSAFSHNKQAWPTSLAGKRQQLNSTKTHAPFFSTQSEKKDMTRARWESLYRRQCVLLPCGDTWKQHNKLCNKWMSFISFSKQNIICGMFHHPTSHQLENSYIEQHTHEHGYWFSASLLITHAHMVQTDTRRVLWFTK